jgi:hypothetical protein
VVHDLMADEARCGMANVRINPDGVFRIQAQAEEIRKAIAEDVASTARRRVPVDTGDLLDSIRVQHTADESRVLVGTDHWAPTEYGSRPHIIRSTGPWPLRNRETGEVFGPSVRHPGTPEQAFMRPSIFQKRRLHT